MKITMINGRVFVVNCELYYYYFQEQKHCAFPVLLVASS